MLDHPKNVIVKDYIQLKYSCSQYFGNNQRFKVEVESQSLPEKDAELFYCFVARLLFRNKIARPDIQACVPYIFTRIKLSMNYYKDRHLDIDSSFMYKFQTFVLLTLVRQIHV